MASPFGSLPNFGPPPKHRRIAPLPQRPRSSSGQPRRRPSPSLSEAVSPESSLAATSPCRHSSHNLTTEEDPNHLSPPGKVGSKLQFGQTISEEGSSRVQPASSTFRMLHNVTPAPSPRIQPTELSSFASLSLSETQLGNPQVLSTDLDSSTARALDDTKSERAPTPQIRVSSESKRSETNGERLGLPNIVPPGQSAHSRSTSDVSVASENEISSVPYDVRDEEAPSGPFFTPGFQDAFREGLNIAKRIVSSMESLEKSFDQEGHLYSLLEDAKNLSNFQNTDTRTIAVLGDSGQGKSSLINSLLHIPDIAMTGDIGQACTSVVTEYLQKRPGQAAPIVIEVEYLSNTEIEELIKELVWSYRQLFLPGVEEDSVDAKDYQRYQRESEQAWSALEAAFKHQRSFTKKLLSDMSEGSLERVTNQLISWTKDIDWPEGGEQGLWTSAASTAAECLEKTKTFMQDQYWPFTKIIRIYLNAQVLKTGVVLADLPGLQDTNLARVKATQMYLMKCDHVFVVANISRAITDQSLKSSLYAVLARHVPLEFEESGGHGLKLAVICTNSENLNEKTARREFCGPRNRELSAEMDQLDREIGAAKEAGNRSLKKQLKRRQECLLMNARNNHVKAGLQAAYASKVPGGMLHVFCVSNTWYEKYTMKGKAELVQASGIPQLRRFCHSVTAEIRFLEAKNFLQSTLSNMLGSIELWADTPSIPQGSENVDTANLIHEAVKDLETKVIKAIQDSRENFRDSFRELILEFAENRNENWEAAAEMKGRQWCYWHWTQYNSWCHNNGDNETAKRAHVNWNAELIWKMRMELAMQWDLLEEEVQPLLAGLLKSIKRELLDLKAFMQEKAHIATLVDGIESRIQDIEYRVGRVERDFAHHIKLIHCNASVPNGASYIVQEMIPSYRAASQEYGTGKAERQRQHVQGRITNGTLFPNISTKISDAMEHLIRTTFHDLTVKAQEIIGLIKKDVDMALGTGTQMITNGGHDEEEERERSLEREMLATEVKALKRLYEEVVLERVKAVLDGEK